MFVNFRYDTDGHYGMKVIAKQGGRSKCQGGFVDPIDLEVHGDGKTFGLEGLVGVR